MRKPRRKLAKRDHLFIVQITGSKVSRTIQHDVNENCSELMAFANQFRQVLALNRKHIRRLFRDNIPWRRDQPGIRHKTCNISAAPFHDLAFSRSLINMNREMATENNMQSGDWSFLRRQDLACCQRVLYAVIGYPLDLLLWSSPQRPMCQQSVKQGF